MKPIPNSGKMLYFKRGLFFKDDITSYNQSFSLCTNMYLSLQSNFLTCYKPTGTTTLTTNNISRRSSGGRALLGLKFPQLHTILHYLLLWSTTTYTTLCQINGLSSRGNILVYYLLYGTVILINPSWL